MLGNVLDGNSLWMAPSAKCLVHGDVDAFCDLEIHKAIDTSTMDSVDASATAMPTESKKYSFATAVDAMLAAKATTTKIPCRC